MRYWSLGSIPAARRRREQKLAEAKARLPSLVTVKCDISRREERARLFKWVEEKYPHLNILVNNAGIQRAVNFRKGAQELLAGENEIEINLIAQVELAAYFVPFLEKKKESAIINISSGLAFVPIAIYPVYSATKAAIHSFSVTLRQQLKNTPVKVFEVAPPTTDTELDKGMREKRGIDKGITAEEVAAATLKGIAGDEFEIAIEEANRLRERSKTDFEETFHEMNDKIPF